MQATIPGDNPSADLNAAYLTAYVDHLHGLGIVTDVDHPQFSFALSDGGQRTVDLGTSTLEAMGTLGILGSAAGDFTEAVRRRDEAIWWRTDRDSGSSWSRSTTTCPPRRPSRPWKPSRLRARGPGRHRSPLPARGDPTPLLPLVQAVSEDARVNRPDGLAVLIGRENESAATVLAYQFDTTTQATLVGSPRPPWLTTSSARARTSTSLPPATCSRSPCPEPAPGTHDRPSCPTGAWPCAPRTFSPDGQRPRYALGH